MRSSTRRAVVGYGFIAPWIIGLLVFTSFPFLTGLYFSFCDYPPLKQPLFIGVENYTELMGDVWFQRSLGVTMVFAAVAIPLGVVAALSLAMLLASKVRGQPIYRVVFYLPHLVPTVVVALLWKWIFNPEVGLLNLTLKQVLRALNAWTSAWFNLKSAAAGEGFVRVGGVVLLVVTVALAWSVWWRRLSGTPRSQRRLSRALRVLTVVLVVAAGVALVNASLWRVMPKDMDKLQSPGWLSDGTAFPETVPFAPSWALWGLIILSLWGIGQMALIYLAKLQDLPVELYEAADVDGATWRQKTWHITLPLMSPVILFNVVMAIIGTFQIFTEPYIMTGGGPEGRTRFLAMFVYENAFQYQRLGYASAVAWVLFVVIVVLTVVAFRVFRKRIYYAGR